MADEDPPFKPGRPVTFGKVKRRLSSKPDDVSPELSTWELQEGYRILLDLMKVSRCFLEAPDTMEKGMGDYYEVIKKPMWFLEMKRKFEEKEYTKLSEFVSDVRLMLLNCYRYFGPNAYHTKRALSVENRLELKLSLLPVEFQSQCTLEATNGPVEDLKDGAEIQSRLLQSVRTERFQREKERRQKLADERKAEEEGQDSEVLQWEREVLFQGDTREIMASMWELPVIGHFVHLGLQHLNIEEIPQFEIERIFLMPQASRSLCIIMTTLLSPPKMRSKLPDKPPMPYKIWTRKLKQKVALWYKMYAKSNYNADIMFEKFGIEHQFWKILGDVCPLEEYEFHELTFHQRVWLIKALCDYLLQHQKILRDLLVAQPEEFGNCLGMDRLGAKFLYFRLFFGQDVRVYRQAPDPPSWIERDLEYQADLGASSTSDGAPKKKRFKRKKKGRSIVPGKASEGQKSSADTRKIIKSGWKHGKLKKLNKSSSSSNQVDNDSPPVLTNSETGELEQPNLNLSPPVLLKETSPSKLSSPKSTVNGDKEFYVHNELQKCDINKKAEGDKDKRDINNKVEEHKEKCNINNKVEEHKEKCDTNNKVEHKEKCNINNKVEDKEKCVVNNKSEEDTVKCDINNKVEEDKEKCDTINQIEKDKVDSNKCVNGVDTENNIVEKDHLNAGIDANMKSDAQTDKTKVEIKSIRKPLYDPHWLRPSPDDFLLVADSVDGMRELLTKYCDDDLELIQRINNAKTGKGSRPSCEIKLAKRLNDLIIEMEPYELQSVMDTKKCRRKLYDEWYAFQNRPEDYVDADETFWLNEKEPVEVPEETPMEEATNDLPSEQEGTFPCQGSEEVEEAPNGILESAPEEIGEVSLDSVPPTGRQRTLRNRRSTVVSFLALWGDKEEESVESKSDSDNSDLWQMSKKKKKRKPRISKVITVEDEETSDGAKPKKQQKKKDRTATEDMTDDQNSSVTTVPASAFEGAFSAWLDDSKKENVKAESKKCTEASGNADSSFTPVPGKHPTSASDVRKKLFNENKNIESVSTTTSATVSTTVSKPETKIKVSASASIVLKHMAQNFAGQASSNVDARSMPSTSTASTKTKTSASKTTAAVEEVVILSDSDDSDDEIQFVGVHNPPPSKSKPPRTKLVLQKYSSSDFVTNNVPATTQAMRPAATQFGIVNNQTSLLRIVTIESVASPTTTVRTQQARQSTITSASSQHSTQSPATVKPNANTLLSTPPSKVAQPVVVGTVGNSSILLTNPQQSSPAASQRKQRTQHALRSPVTAVARPSPSAVHSLSPLAAHTTTQALRSPQTAAMRSPSQVSVRSPATTVLPVGTEITLRPSPVHSQVQVPSPVQATRFTLPSGGMPASLSVTPASVGNMAQVASGTKATLVVVPGDGNTASNYALAFSNGTRMILTPEQVAQIRADNNGVLGIGNLSGVFGQ